MPTYDVTPENMRTIATKIRTLAKEYETLYTNNLLQQLVGSDLKEAYKGTDASALVNRLESYQAPFSNMKKQLDTYADFLDATATSYQNTADTFAQEAANIGR